MFDIEKASLLSLDIKRDDGTVDTIYGRYSAARIPDHEVPDKRYRYSIRHAEDDPSTPAAVVKGRGDDLYGDLVTTVRVDFQGKERLEIIDWDFLS
jgi:hypothetical protein